jgi:3-hydroxyisobutyrate dehydrogenase
MKIAWFGAGMMGSGFVEALRRRGDEVRVWNRTPAKAKALEQFGALAVEQPRAALEGVERVHIILSDDAAVDGLLAQIADAIPKGVPVIDHTTVAPQPTVSRFQWCAERSIEFLHAPVFMGPQSCRDGTGLMMCAGPRARFERVENELRKMTGELWYVGERVDKAAALKLFGNSMLLTIVAGLADGYRMMRAVDIPPPEAFELFTHFKPGGAIEMRGKKMAAGEFAPPSFELTMARKDARLMLETALEGGMPLHLLPAIAGWMDEAIAAGHGQQDMGVLAIDALPAAAR